MVQHSVKLTNELSCIWLVFKISCYSIPRSSIENFNIWKERTITILENRELMEVMIGKVTRDDCKDENNKEHIMLRIRRLIC